MCWDVHLFLVGLPALELQLPQKETSASPFLLCLQLCLVHSSHSMDVHWTDKWVKDLCEWLFGCACYCFFRLGAWKCSSQFKGAGIWNVNRYGQVDLQSNNVLIYFHEWYEGEFASSHSCQHSPLTNNFLSSLSLEKCILSWILLQLTMFLLLALVEVLICELLVSIFVPFLI